MVEREEGGQVDGGAMPICWFCDYERERSHRNQDAWMAMLFAAVMPFKKMMESLCGRHHAAFKCMYSWKRRA
jgi:hypothetical protein